MDIIYEIRRRHSVQKQTITAIARDMGISRPTVRKHLNTVEEPKYERVQAASPKLGQFAEQLTQWLEEESKLSRQRRRSAHRLFEGLQEIGYIGDYDSVQRFVKRWKSGTDSISLKTKLDEDSGDEQVTFEPFTGVGARRFLDFFSMSLGTGNKLKRKNKDGSILEWKKQDAIIRVKLIPESYINIESAAASIFDLKNQP